MTVPQDDKQLAECNKYYATDQALEALSTWYTNEKEEAFVDYVFDRLQLPTDGDIVEIGGGAAIHGRILARRYGERYLFTDYSPLFVENAAKLELPAMQMDGLASTLPAGRAACALLVGTSTFVSDADMRRRQFAQCARILKPGGAAVFVTATYGQKAGFHRLGVADEEMLTQCGFSVGWCGTWGILPGRLWSSANKNVFVALEKFIAPANVSGRTILVGYRNS